MNVERKALERDGYDIMASAMCFEGGDFVDVLSNNSTHFLVAVRRDDNVSDLIESYRYGEDDLRYVYSQALTKMETYALEH